MQGVSIRTFAPAPCFRRVIRVAAVLAAAFIAGQIAVRPALADHDGDRKICSLYDDHKLSERIDACTRVIKSGRVSGGNLARSYNLRGEAYRLNEQYELALADYARSIAIKPAAEYFANRAEVHRLQGRYDLVVDDATQAIGLDPTLNASYTIRGMAYEKIDDKARARADFNKALELPVKGNDGEWAQDLARKHLKDMD
jgi:tetratricopeptide (TPR) repeat protein